MKIPAIVKDNALVLAAVAAVGLLLLKKNLSGVVADAAAGAVGVVADAGAGVAIGIGDIIGLPRTNETECQRAMREGRTWDASFICPAGTFLQYVNPLADSSKPPATPQSAGIFDSAGQWLGSNLYDWLH